MWAVLCSGCWSAMALAEPSPFRLLGNAPRELNIEVHLVDLPMAGVDPGQLQMRQYPSRRQDPPRMYVNPLAKQWLDPGPMTVERMDRSIFEPGRLSLGQMAQKPFERARLEIGEIPQGFVDPGEMQVRELWMPNPDPMPMRVDALPNVINKPPRIQLDPILKPTIQYRSIIFDPGSDHPPAVHEEYRRPPAPAQPPRRQAVRW